MTRAEQLQIMKLDLQISSDAVDNRFVQLLDASAGFIAAEGITLTDSAVDNHLTIVYAEYLWRKRNDECMAMPRSLRFALNNRLFKEKAGGLNV